MTETYRSFDTLTPAESAAGEPDRPRHPPLFKWKASAARKALVAQTTAVERARIETMVQPANGFVRLSEENGKDAH